jgi:hypothetical protein
MVAVTGGLMFSAVELVVLTNVSVVVGTVEDGGSLKLRERALAFDNYFLSRAMLFWCSM